MNYLYQIRGLIVDTARSRARRSSTTRARCSAYRRLRPSGPRLNENSLTEAPGIRVEIRRGLQSLSSHGGFHPPASVPAQSDPVTRHCDGTRLTQSEIDAGVTMFSIDGDNGRQAQSTGTANGVADTGTYSQDINFNRGPNPFLTPATVTDGPFSGFNDWANIDLRQVGSRRNVVSSGLGRRHVARHGIGGFRSRAISVWEILAWGISGSAISAWATLASAILVWEISGWVTSVRALRNWIWRQRWERWAEVLRMRWPQH